MKTLLKIGVFGVLYLLAAGATGFYFEYSKEQPADEESGDTAQASSESDGTEQVPELVVGDPPSGLPVALRPKSDTSVDAIVQMSDSIRRTEKLLEDREKRVSESEERIALLFEDLALEREELKALSQSLDTKMNSISTLTDQLRNRLDELSLKEEKLKELAKSAGTDEASVSEDLENRVNDVKAWFENLEPKQAADYLREFANNGKLEFAATLLQKMPNRQQSKILAEMSDPALVEQLIDSLAPRK